MNTTAKGTDFEQRVATILRNQLEEGQLGLISEYSRLYTRKGYRSKELDKDIITDISIETSLPGATEFSILTVIECKNYKGTVPINDIKEFRDNLREIGAHKGIMVAAGAFSDGVVKIATSSKISLLRIIPDEMLQWVLYRTSARSISAAKMQYFSQEIHNALYMDNPPGCIGPFVGLVGDHTTLTLSQFFDHHFQDERESNPDLFKHTFTESPDDSAVKWLPEKDILQQTESLLCGQLRPTWETPLDNIVAQLENDGRLTLEYREDLGVDSQKKPILGAITFNPTRITISRHANENLHRRRFTIAHELGHYFLGHEKYMSREYYSVNDFENLGKETATLEDITRMEWQANMFASHLLLPLDGLREELQRLFRHLDIRDKGYGTLYLDNQACNYRQFMQVTDYLMEKFCVSRKVVEIALKRQRILNDVRTVPSKVGSVLGNVIAQAVKRTAG